LLTAGVLPACMIVPSITAVGREVLLAVPQAQRDGALALGATRWETVWQVVLPYARSGILGATILAVARALGETMAVTMVIGNRPDIATSLFAPAHTMAAVLANEFAEAVSDVHLAALVDVGLVLVGSAKLLLVAAAVGIPVGVLGGVYLAEYDGGAVAFAVRYAADVLNGIPSIVIGITVYGLVVVPLGHFSTLAGGFALGLLMIPVVLRTTEEFLRLVPDSLRDASLALGAPQWVTIVRGVIPAGMRGILTGLLLSLARVAGETAPLLFTALSNRFWSPGWLQPTASLPVMIF